MILAIGDLFIFLAMTFVENGKHVVSNQDFEAAWSLV